MNAVSLLIPFYNHGRFIGRVVDGLEPLGLPCLIVDDGSKASEGAVLDALAQSRSWLRVMRRQANGGKGEAVKEGLCRLHEEGVEHAVQLDADGQHALADVPRFVQEAKEHPEALILGSPLFDRSVPTSRLVGRQISRVWVWIETLSFQISDPLCGFRCYPVKSSVALIRSQPLGSRMEFDPEIAVRLVWSGVRVRNIPTTVVYHAESISHFDLWRDNLRISGLHARLFFGMLARLPQWCLRGKS